MRGGHVFVCDVVRDEHEEDEDVGERFLGLIIW
jgi:hypothetical protein